MKYHLFFFIVVLTLCASCNTKQEDDLNGITLKVDLKEQDISMNKLFSRMEVIPLETKDSCLIIDIEKIIIHQNLFYIFDQRKPAIYLFQENGHFLKEIARKGEGPGEYQAIADVLLDETNKKLILLSPFGSMLSYGITGTFMGQDVLPIKPNYYSISTLPNNALVLWSCVEEEETGISIIHRDSMKIIHETWHNDRMLDMGLMKPFYSYNGETYFSTAYQNTVYHINNNSLKKAYQWDFGENNIEQKTLLAYNQIKNANEKNNKILKDLEEGVLPYAMERHNQNDKYYYVALRKGIGFNRPWINVFYQKSDGKYYVFEQVKEGIHIHPILFTNDFLISILPLEDIKFYREILPESEYAKLVSYSSDDNPCLIKLYFQ